MDGDSSLESLPVGMEAASHGPAGGAGIGATRKPRPFSRRSLQFHETVAPVSNSNGDGPLTAHSTIGPVTKALSERLDSAFEEVTSSMDRLDGLARDADEMVKVPVIATIDEKIAMLKSFYSTSEEHMWEMMRAELTTHELNTRQVELLLRENHTMAKRLALALEIVHTKQTDVIESVQRIAEDALKAVRDMENKLSPLNHKNSMLTAQSESLNANLRSSEQTIKQLEKTIQELSSEARRCELLSDESERKRVNLEQKCQSLESDLVQNRHDIQNMNKQLATSRDDADILRRELQTARADNVNQEKQFEERRRRFETEVTKQSNDYRNQVDAKLKEQQLSQEQRYRRDMGVMEQELKEKDRLLELSEKRAKDADEQRKLAQTKIVQLTSNIDSIKASLRAQCSKKLMSTCGKVAHDFMHDVTTDTDVEAERYPYAMEALRSSNHRRFHSGGNSRVNDYIGQGQENRPQSHGGEEGRGSPRRKQARTDGSNSRCDRNNEYR